MRATLIGHIFMIQFQKNKATWRAQPIPNSRKFSWNTNNILIIPILETSHQPNIWHSSSHFYKSNLHHYLLVIHLYIFHFELPLYRSILIMCIILVQLSTCMIYWIYAEDEEDHHPDRDHPRLGHKSVILSAQVLKFFY